MALCMLLLFGGAWCAVAYEAILPPPTSSKLGPLPYAAWQWDLAVASALMPCPRGIHCMFSRKQRGCGTGGGLWHFVGDGGFDNSNAMPLRIRCNPSAISRGSF